MAFHRKALLVSVAVLVVVLGTSTRLAEAQSSVPSCASKLVDCYQFINSTSTPDAKCCNGIKDAVANDLSCLCTIYTTPGLLSSFNITVSQALGLSQRCGVSADVSRCSATSPSSSVPPPPGAAGGDTGSAGRIAWTGISSLLLFWASMILY